MPSYAGRSPVVDQRHGITRRHIGQRQRRLHDQSVGHSDGQMFANAPRLENSAIIKNCFYSSFKVIHKICNNIN